MNLIDEIPNRMAENAAFLWLLHGQALDSADYDLAELEELESRIDAQLDGLIAYGEEGWNACEAALQFEEPGEIFTAAVIAFAHGTNQQLKQVVELGCQSEENHAALQSALAWLPFDTVKVWIGKLMYADNPAYSSLGVTACALHGANCGDVLKKVIANPNMLSSPEYFSQVMRAAALMGRTDVSDDLAAYQHSADPQLVLASIHYASMMGDKSNMSLLKPLLMANVEFAEKMVGLVFRSLSLTEAKTWLSEMSQLPELQRVLIKAVGVLGDTSYLPWLIEQMKDEMVAKVAAESFSKMLGIDIDKEGLSIAYSVNEDDDDSNDDGPDMHLPNPDYKKVAHWYSMNTEHIVSGKRYLAGKPITEEHCLFLMEHGVQNQRRAAHLELLINRAGQSVGENRRRLRV